MPKQKKKDNEFKIKTFFITSIVTAASLVVGLFWKDVITQAIDKFINKTDALFVNFITAIILTFVAGVIIYLLYKSQKIGEKYEKSVRRTVRRQTKIIENRRRRYVRTLKRSRV
jgi:hypothetical protein